jgi:phospholipid/cholesterol/gamma-HCH transport system substrate-binding protein
MQGSKKFWVGVFIVGGVLLFCVGLFIIGSSQQMFQGHFHAYTDYKSIDTLTQGARVRVSGMDAGQVTGIDVPQAPTGQFRLHLEIDSKFHGLVRENSVTTIETSGMVGSKYVDVKMGTVNSPECNDCTLKSQEAGGMQALMKEGAGLVKQVQSTISDVQHHADSAIDNFSSIATNVNQMIDHEKRNVNAITTNAAHLTGNANAIAIDLRQGRGTAGKLLTDPTMASNVESTIANAKQTSANVEKASENVQSMVANVQQQDLPDVHATIANAKDMSSQLDQAVGTFLSKGNSNGGENTAEAMRDTVQNARQAAGNLADDTEAIKHNFFLRGFFKRRGYFNLSDITRSQYPGTEFVRKPTVRVWVPDTGLFSIGPDGSQQLTDQGKNLIDQNMSDLVPFLPRNPIMVEGYAKMGQPDQRYVASRDRAVAVRDYLESRFHLSSKVVGIMPMGDHPPQGSGKQEWNGVALVLVKSK